LDLNSVFLYYRQDESDSSESDDESFGLARAPTRRLQLRSSSLGDLLPASVKEKGGP